MSAKNLQYEHITEALFENGYYQYTWSRQIKRWCHVLLIYCILVLIFFCRISHLTTSVDIKPIPNPDVERAGTRPRGMGKLLSTQKEVGLALLRLEHVAGVQRGEIKLELEVSTEGDQKSSCTVIPFWPDWWPTSKDCSTD